jgi:hypothetical protein
MYYILQNMRPHPARFFEHEAWTATNNRVIDRTEIEDVLVLTAFHGIDDSFGDGPPLLFETVVFGGNLDGASWRYATLGAAKRGHHEVVAEVRRG